MTTIKIDPEKKMLKISVGWSICDSIVGLKIYDAQGKKYVSENWLHQSGIDQKAEIGEDGGYVAKLMEWETKNVPKGEKIIGLKWHKDKWGDIKRLGLIFWSE